MLFFQTNHRIIATYGGGSGNAPALHYNGRRTPVSGFFSNPKPLYYEQFRKTC